MNTAMSSLQAVSAFDQLATTYDEIFTTSPIGRAQRRAVWRVADRLWGPGDHLLELNCGTGEDALHFAGRGIMVTACDASPGMISVAQKRSRRESRVRFTELRTEELRSADLGAQFTGVFSNFSGLNCVADLKAVARDLSSFLPSGSALLCLSTRYCLSECAWYLAQGRFATASRRWTGYTVARVEDRHVPVSYWTVAEVKKLFQPWFRLKEIHGIGVFVPPSYLNSHFRQHARLLSALESADRFASRVPVLRCVGDHVLLHFERSAG